MCGIGGILKITGPGERHEPIPEAWLDAMDAQIAWRGPDGSGRFRDRVTLSYGTTVEVALVHRRLSIIDHQGGGQPFVVKGCPACDAANRDRRRRSLEFAAENDIGPYASTDDIADDLTAVVFNGCIYNHRELRAELEALGHVFTSDHSDTEVIAHAWSQWCDVHPILHNQALIDRLDGMYALALWNRGDAMLWTARDRHGEKPLFGTQSPQHDPDVYAVASTVRALHHLRDLDDAPSAYNDDGAISSLVPDMLWHDRRTWHPPTEPSTPITGVFQHRRSFCSDFDTFSCSATHGNPTYGCSTSLIGLAFALGALAGVVFLPTYIAQIAIAFWPVVALAFMLTGLVLLVVKLIVPWRKMRSRHISVLARTMPDVADEVISKAVALRLEADVPLGCFLSGGIDSSLVASYAHERLGNLRTFCVRMPDQRYDESAYAQRVADAIGTDHTTVECDASHAADDLVHLIGLLGLPFADSSLLPTYWLCKAARAHVKVALSGDGGDEMFYGYDRYRAAPYLTGLLTPYARYKLPRLDRSDPRSRDERVARFLSAAKGAGYLDLVSVFPHEEAKQLLGRSTRLRFRRVGRTVADARRWDVENYLPCDLMRKVDTASMAVGLEVRSPLLSMEVTKFADRIPAGAHMYGESKHILKELARRRLGDAIADRPKQGFAIPISDWWRTDFGGLRTLLFDCLDKPQPFGNVHDVLPINMDYVRQMIDEHWAAGGLTQPYSTKPARRRDHGQRLFALVTLALWAREKGPGGQIASRQ